GDQLLGHRERPIDDGAVLTGEEHPRAPRAWVQSVAVDHHAGLRQLLVVLVHLSQELLVRHHACFGIRVGLDQYHETHERLPFLCEPSYADTSDRASPSPRNAASLPCDTYLSSGRPPIRHGQPGNLRIRLFRFIRQYTETSTIRQSGNRSEMS